MCALARVYTYLLGKSAVCAHTYVTLVTPHLRTHADMKSYNEVCALSGVKYSHLFM